MLAVTVCRMGHGRLVPKFSYAKMRSCLIFHFTLAEASAVGDHRPSKMLGRQGTTMTPPPNIRTSDKLVVKKPTTWTPLPVPASAMQIVSPTDPTPNWDPALTGPPPSQFYAMPQNFSEDDVKKSLTTRQDFREMPSYPGDWQTGLVDCCAPPGGCETCLMGERASGDARVATRAAPMHACQEERGSLPCSCVLVF